MIRKPFSQEKLLRSRQAMASLAQVQAQMPENPDEDSRMPGLAGILGKTELAGDRLSWANTAAPGSLWGELLAFLFVSIYLFAVVGLLAVFVSAGILLVGLVWDFLFASEFTVANYLADALQTGVDIMNSPWTWTIAALLALLIAIYLIAQLIKGSVRYFEFDANAGTLALSTSHLFGERTRNHVVPFESIASIEPVEDKGLACLNLRYAKADGKEESWLVQMNLPMADCSAHIEWLRHTLGDKVRPLRRQRT